MNQDQIKAIQAKVGTEPDGFWGPKSIAACQKYLREMMPVPHPWPTKKDITKFYGQHGVNGGFTPPMAAVKLSFPMYYDGKPVKTMRAHEKIADSLGNVFAQLAEVYPTVELQKSSGISAYFGIYNPRPMRGGSSWSMHSWAIAIDLDANKNGNNTYWPTKAVMPLEVMECFSVEGWTSAGAFWSRDAMHFEAVHP